MVLSKNRREVSTIPCPRLVDSSVISTVSYRAAAGRKLAKHFPSITPKRHAVLRQASLRMSSVHARDQAVKHSGLLGYISESFYRSYLKMS